MKKNFRQMEKPILPPLMVHYGTKGFVTDVIRQSLEFDCCILVDQLPMLKALETNYQIRKYFYHWKNEWAAGSEPALLVCAIPGDDPTVLSYKKVCSDGPVFQGRGGNTMSTIERRITWIKIEKSYYACIGLFWIWL